MTIETTGTCYQGTIKAGFGTLSHMLGKPEFLVDNFKSDVQWVLTFDDGSVATIYNWKNGKNYLGEKGIPIVQITNWNIGGHNERALKNVERLLGRKGDDVSCYLCQSVFDARNEGGLIHDRFICRTCDNTYDDDEIEEMTREE
jgi:hypothetical protein